MGGMLSCRGRAQSNPECSRLTPTTLVVRILPRSQAERFKQPHFVFGFAQTESSGGFGYYASVFYHRVEELSGIFTSSTPVVLGHVIAHEMGHLLLGHGGHSRTGLMTANWDRKELERVNQRTFIFNSQQAKEIRARFLERHSSAEASRLDQVAEKRPIGGAADGAGRNRIGPQPPLENLAGFQPAFPRSFRVQALACGARRAKLKLEL